ncbi:MAG: ATP-binding protein [Deltaproteobacteria bacterium]|nr:ATP-binding protein [Deltaproteobacteria bacterium]
MITLIEALHYRSLRYLSQELGPFQILVGENASGKTTFLDVLVFFGRFLAEGLETAVHERTNNFQDLVWQRAGDSFEMAVEADIPAHLTVKLANPAQNKYRYEISVGLDPKTRALSILGEKALLITPSTQEEEPTQLTFFPRSLEPPPTIATSSGQRRNKVVLNKTRAGNDNYYSETARRWNPSFKLGLKKSALGNIPDDEERFPVSIWFKELMVQGVKAFAFNPVMMKNASPPGQIPGLKPDGSNLPWVIKGFKETHLDCFTGWVNSLKTVLPDLEDIEIIQRDEDRYCFLEFTYQDSLKTPSWVASDGTLRLTALTLLAHLPHKSRVYLIEEPENGIHLKALAGVVKALSSASASQILLTTHSPAVLELADPAKVLCFAKTREGATDVVPGCEHPMMVEHGGQANIGDLFNRGLLS